MPRLQFGTILESALVEAERLEAGAQIPGDERPIAMEDRVHALTAAHEAQRTSGKLSPVVDPAPNSRSDPPRREPSKRRPPAGRTAARRSPRNVEMRPAAAPHRS